MTQQDVILDIEARARTAGVSIKDLCTSAGVHPTSFSRWKQSEANPNPGGANMKLIEALYTELERREKANA